MRCVYRYLNQVKQSKMFSCIIIMGNDDLSGSLFLM